MAAAFEECLVSMEDLENRGAGMALEPKSSGAAAALDKSLVSMEDMEDRGAAAAL